MGTANERLEILNLSQEEMKNMTAMMKDSKFMELFADYANEIADPNNRKEMETALRDAESKGERVPGFPSDKDLLIPTAAFCAKTKNQITGEKVFINICHSWKIAKPKGSEAKDKSGTAWEIPYSLAPAQRDKDRQGGACETHDFVVSTETHNMAHMDRRFKNFLVDTAIDAIQTQRLVQLSRDFSLPNLKYKGQTKEPKMLTISKGPHKPAPCLPSVVGNEDSPSLTMEIEPKYKVVYRNHLNFTKFWDDTINLPTEKDKPTDIVLRVDLPNVNTIHDIELKVTEYNVHLLVPGNYKLELKLQYPVDEEKGQAKFNASKHQLEITFPISHPPLQSLT